MFFIMLTKHHICNETNAKGEELKVSVPAADFDKLGRVTSEDGSLVDFSEKYIRENRFVVLQDVLKKAIGQKTVILEALESVKEIKQKKGDLLSFLVCYGQYVKIDGGYTTIAQREMKGDERLGENLRNVFGNNSPFNIATYIALKLWNSGSFIGYDGERIGGNTYFICSFADLSAENPPIADCANLAVMSYYSGRVEGYKVHLRYDINVFTKQRSDNSRYAIMQGHSLKWKGGTDECDRETGDMLAHSTGKKNKSLADSRRMLFTYDLNEEVKMFRKRSDVDKEILELKNEEIINMLVLVMVTEHELCHALLNRNNERLDQCKEIALTQSGKIFPTYSNETHNVHFVALTKRIFGHVQVTVPIDRQDKTKGKKRKIEEEGEEGEEGEERCIVQLHDFHVSLKF